MRIGNYDPAEIPTETQLIEVEREIEFRWRVYARNVKAGRMTQDQMDKRIATMIAIRDHLRGRVAAAPRAGELPL